MEQMDASGLLLRYTQGQRVFRGLFLMGGSTSKTSGRHGGYSLPSS